MKHYHGSHSKGYDAAYPSLCLSNGSSLANEHNHSKKNKRLSYIIIEYISEF